MWRPACLALTVAALLVGIRSVAAGETALAPNLIFSCRADNDLFRVLKESGVDCPRCDAPSEAVQAAPEGAGVLILADAYPQKATTVEAAVYEAAAQRRLRLYVEFPAALPGMSVGVLRRTSLERVVVTQRCQEPLSASSLPGNEDSPPTKVPDTFARPALRPLQILAIHDCHFVEVQADRPWLVLAKVAGFDTAAYGLAGAKTFPVLFEHPRGDILVSTTKLSQFVSARYAPRDAMRAVWRMVFEWLQPGRKAPAIDWTPTVRPTYAREAPLPSDAARRAIVRGIDWHSKAKMLLSEPGWREYQQLRVRGKVNANNPVAPQPDATLTAGDGRFGVLEGVSSQVAFDGRQPVRWWLRTDCNGESSLAFALRWKLDGHQHSRTVAANLLDWVYTTSGLFQNDPAKANFGLLYWAPDNDQSLYEDNDVKAILGCLGTVGVLQTDRWDEPLVKNILGNFRTTGVYGFRGYCLNNHDLLRRGWKAFWQARTIHYQPHYEAWIWAAYLWLYDKTRYAPLLERTRESLRTTMAAYPEGWRWTNGIQQERGRMLLPLAWLVRVDDRPEHRAWLKRLADDIQRSQVACGAIREELGALEQGDLRPPRSNAEYGSNEASLIQANGDPVADLLYTCNFTFLGLHEAHAATGDPQYRHMADRLAEFLVRVQVQSEAHPELDGGWFRAFDFRQWDYWGSNADSGWGAWSIEVGWTQAWIPTVLALRELKWNLWDLSKGSKAGKHFERYRRLMLEGATYTPPPANRPKR